MSDQGISIGKRVTLHATLVLVDGEGVLIAGDAASGKSSIALRLLKEGHSLVADDVVMVEQRSGKLFGSAPANLQGVISIPDLGIFDVRDVFGIESFTESSRIDRCLSIFPSRPNSELGPEILGVRVPLTFLEVENGADREFHADSIDLASVKQSEARILQAHDALVASAT